MAIQQTEALIFVLLVRMQKYAPDALMVLLLVLIPLRQTLLVSLRLAHLAQLAYALMENGWIGKLLLALIVWPTLNNAALVQKSSHAMLDTISNKALAEIVAQHAKLIAPHVKPLKRATHARLTTSSHSTKHATRFHFAWLVNTFPRVNLNALTALLTALLVVLELAFATRARTDST